MSQGVALPRFEFRPDMPSLWHMIRCGVSDPGNVIPASILTEPAVQLPGLGAPLVVAEPGLAREVLNDREGRFVRNKIMHRLLRRAWGKGLAAAEGDDWQQQRRAAAPAFRPHAVELNGAAFASAAATAAGQWPIGEPTELTEQAARIIARIVFTTLVDGKDRVDSAAVAADIPAYVRRIASFGLRDMLPLPEAWHDRLSGIVGDPAVQRVRALASRLAGERRADGQAADLIALLEEAGPVEDNIRGLFPAAMDTTVAGASWALYTLALRPEWQTSVAEEARGCNGVFTLDRLSLTRRVVQEVLRLYPPGPLLTRNAGKAGTLGGFPLRKGQPVLIHVYAMHRHHALWDDPDQFDPDRFLPERGVHPGWLPFGSGPRVCIAAQFALAEIAIVVARLVSELEFVSAGSEPRVSLQVSTRSSTGLTVVANRRA
jgi:cytochrome P450